MGPLLGYARALWAAECIVKMRASAPGVAEYVVNMRGPALGVAELRVNLRTLLFGACKNTYKNAKVQIRRLRFACKFTYFAEMCKLQNTVFQH